MQVELWSERQLAAEADGWNALWQRSDVASPASRAEQLLIWVKHFGQGHPFTALVVRDAGRPVAALPLVLVPVAGCVTVAMLPAGEWSLPADLLLDPQSNASDVCRELLRGVQRLPSSILWLDEVAWQSARWTALRDAAAAEGLQLAVREQYEIGVADVADNWEQFFAARPARHRQRRRAQRRKLESLGRVGFEVVEPAEPEQVAGWLQRGFAVEDRSWKRDAGTSVLRSSEIFDYYLDQARALAEHGQLQLVFLMLDEQPIAFSYGMWAKGVYFNAKLGCDERYRQGGTGHQLTLEILRHQHARSEARALDFAGPLADWQSGWIDRRYSLARLVAALPSVRNRVLIHLYAHWLPRLRSLRQCARWTA